MRAEPGRTSAEDLSVTGLAHLLRPGGAFFITNPPSSSAAHLALALRALGNRPVVAITDGSRTLDVLWRDLAALAVLRPLSSHIFRRGNLCPATELRRPPT